MHTDTDRQRIAGYGVVLRHSELGIRDVFYELILRRYPRPTIKDEQSLVRAGHHGVVVEWLIEAVLMPLDHDECPCSTVEPPPFQPFENAAASACCAITANDLLDLIGR